MAIAASSMQDLTQLTQLFESAWAVDDYAAALHYAAGAARLCAGLDTGNPVRRRADWNLALACKATGDLVQAERLLRSLLAIAKSLLGARDSEVADILLELGGLYNLAGDYEQAETVLREALEIKREAHEAEDLRVGLILNELGFLCHRTGRLEAATSFYEEALAVFRGAKTNDQLAAPAHNLAEIYRLLGHLERAQALCRESMANLREGDPRLVSALNLLATLTFDRGEVLAARDGFFRALAEAKKSLGARHPDFPLILQNLATTYRITGEPERAIRFFRRSLALRESSPRGGDPAETALIEVNLGGALVVAGEAAAAKPIFLNAYKKLRRALGEVHPWIALALNGLGGTHQQLYRYPQAAALYRRAEEICRAALGDRHPEVAHILCNRGNLLAKMRDFKAAEALCREAIAIYEENSLSGEPRYLEALAFLGEVCSTLHRPSEAEAYLVRFKAHALEVLAPQHPLFLRSLLRLAAVYKALEKLPEAQELLQQALETCRASVSEDDLLFAECLEGVGDFQVGAGQIADAKKLYFMALRIRRHSSEVDELEIAMDFRRLGIVYGLLADVRRAESMYLQALASEKEAMGDDGFLSALLFFDLADVCIARGEYDRAAELQNQALELRRLWYGEPSLEVAQSILGQARLEFVKGHYHQSERLCERTIDMWAQVQTEEPGAAFGAWSLLAQVHHELGDLEQAEIAARRALADSEPFILSRAVTLNDLGLILVSRGRYDEARDCLDDALRLQVQVFGKEHIKCAQTLGNLAVLCCATGQLDRSEDLSRESLRIRKAVLREGHPEIATGLIGLEMVLQMKGDLIEADALLREALEIWRAAAGENSLSYAVGLMNLANLHFAARRFAKTESFLLQAAKIASEAVGEDHPLYAQIANNLGALSYLRGRLEEADGWLRQALKIRRKVFGPRHATVAEALGNLANLYRNRGDSRRAANLCRQVLAILKDTVGELSQAYALALQSQAEMEWMEGHLEEAGVGFKRSFDLFRQTTGLHQPNMITGLLTRAMFLIDCGKLGEAKEQIEQAERLSDEMIGRTFAISSEAERAEFLLRARTIFSMALSVMISFFDLEQEARTILDLVFRRKALNVEALAVQTRTLLTGRRPDLEPVMQRLIEVRDQAGRSALAGAGREGLEEHEKLLSEWDRERESLEARLARELPEIRLGESLKRAYRPEIAAALPAGSALVEFLRHDCFERQEIGDWDWEGARFLAFVLRAGEPEGVQCIDLGDAEVIEFVVTEFRATVLRGKGRELDEEDRGRRADEEFRLWGDALRVLVFDPLLEAIAGCERLVLAPDGDVSWVPFEVLPLPEGEPLLEKYEISYLGTGRDVLRWGPSGVTPGDPVVIADPDFDLAAQGDQPAPDSLLLGPVYELQRKARHFERLSGTRREGEFIAKRLGVSPWMGQDAREGNLKSAPSPWILHIATHGFFLRDPQKLKTLSELAKPSRSTRADELRLGDVPRAENPLLRSGLALAGANSRIAGRLLPEDAEDGILTAEDVTGLNLQGTEMVVLSACETGLGEPLAGEGVMGLRRSFTIAGARTLIMSLWPVPDRETQELMEDFYRKVLDERMPRAEALRQAQRAMRARPGRSHPFYWGAFICQGDPGPLAPAHPAG